jgi:hypothetical protein
VFLVHLVMTGVSQTILGGTSHLVVMRVTGMVAGMLVGVLALPTMFLTVHYEPRFRGRFLDRAALALLVWEYFGNLPLLSK